MIFSSKPLRFLLHRNYISPYLLLEMQGLRLVEVAGEADLVADLDAVRGVPSVGGVGQHLPAKECFNTALLSERYLLRVPQVGVRLVLDDDALSVPRQLRSVRGLGPIPPRPACGSS